MDQRELYKLVESLLGEGRRLDDTRSGWPEKCLRLRNWSMSESETTEKLAWKCISI
jgi:hypothetical protein